MTIGPTRLTKDAPLVALGDHMRNAALSSVVTLTAPTGAAVLVFTVETKAIRVRLDGGTPTTTVGLLYSAGGPYTLGVVPGQVIKLIEAEASAVLNYQWSA